MLNKEFKGVVIEESLDNNRILNDINVVGLKISDGDADASPWHSYTVMVSLEEIEKLSKHIKNPWYMHFWKDTKVIVVYKDKIFELDYNNKSTWKSAVEYGVSIGITINQLDFPIN